MKKSRARCLVGSSAFLTAASRVVSKRKRGVVLVAGGKEETGYGSDGGVGLSLDDMLLGLIASAVQLFV